MRALPAGTVAAGVVSAFAADLQVGALADHALLPCTVYHRHSLPACTRHPPPATHQPRGRSGMTYR